MDEWAFNDDHEDSYEYGYDYLYEESENRPANPEADEAEEDREFAKRCRQAKVSATRLTDEVVKISNL